MIVLYLVESNEDHSVNGPPCSSGFYCWNAPEFLISKTNRSVLTERPEADSLSS